MEITDIIAMCLGGIGFIISIIGYVITPMLNLKSTRLQKRLEFRFILFEKIIQLWELTHFSNLSDPNFEVLIIEINKLIKLYGYNEEISLFNNFTISYNEYAKDQSRINEKDFTDAFNNFISYSMNTYRKELCYK
jgi:hypothetical protein